MRIVLLGLPGSGKGTQAHILSEMLNIPFLGAGDLLRHEVSAGTEAGKRIAPKMKAGGLPADDDVTEIVLSNLDKCKAFVLDGYPRSLSQAESLDAYLKDKEISLNAVVYLKVSEAVALCRIGQRRNCAQCGAPAMLEDTENPCRFCGGGTFTGRQDDSEAIARKRWQLQSEKLSALLKHYCSRSFFCEVDAVQKPEQVSVSILKFMKLPSPLFRWEKV
jgi:adenylate kinase